jgi:hypothetical protein
MDPSRCTIVYLQQASTIQPFSIDDDNNNESDSTHILESVFGQGEWRDYLFIIIIF